MRNLSKFTAKRGADVRGFTLIELMVGVVIISVAIVAIVARVNTTRQNTQVNTELANLETIVAAAKSSFSGQTSYAGLTNAILLSANAFPSQMVNAGAVTNSWSGPVTATPQTVPAAVNTRIQVAYDGVPTGACINLINSASKTADGIYVTATPIKPIGGVLDTAANIATACGTASTVAVNFIYNG